jgi:hypothetical protein
MTTMEIPYLPAATGGYICPHCGETKARKNTMFYHIKKHIGALDYVCSEPGCGKAFVQKSGLEQHRLHAHTEAGAATWGCPCCAHTALTKANMLIHIGRIHGAPWIPTMGSGACDCPGCAKSLASVTAYYYHAMSCFKVPLVPVPPGPKTAAATSPVE